MLWLFIELLSISFPAYHKKYHGHGMKGVKSTTTTKKKTVVNTFSQPMAAWRCNWSPVRWSQTPAGVITPASSTSLGRESTKLWCVQGCGLGVFVEVVCSQRTFCHWWLGPHCSPAPAGKWKVPLRLEHLGWLLITTRYWKTRRSLGYIFFFSHGGVSTSRGVRCQTEEITLLGGVHLLISREENSLLVQSSVPGGLEVSCRRSLLRSEVTALPALRAFVESYAAFIQDNDVGSCLYRKHPLCFSF